MNSNNYITLGKRFPLPAQNKLAVMEEYKVKLRKVVGRLSNLGAVNSLWNNFSARSYENIDFELEGCCYVGICTSKTSKEIEEIVGSGWVCEEGAVFSK